MIVLIIHMIVQEYVVETNVLMNVESVVEMENQIIGAIVMVIF